MMKKLVSSQAPHALRERRKQIDLIDKKLLSLLNRRLSIALKIGKIKKEMGLKIYDPVREAEILRRLASKNKGPLKKKDVEKIFSTLMKISRSSQR